MNCSKNCGACYRRPQRIDAGQRRRTAPPIFVCLFGDHERSRQRFAPATFCRFCPVAGTGKPRPALARLSSWAGGGALSQPCPVALTPVVSSSPRSWRRWRFCRTSASMRPLRIAPPRESGTTRATADDNYPVVAIRFLNCPLGYIEAPSRARAGGIAFRWSRFAGLWRVFALLAGLIVVREFLPVPRLFGR